MSQMNDLNEGEMEKELQADISFIHKINEQPNKIMSSELQLSSYEEGADSSILQHSQKIRLTIPELADNIDKFNELSKQLDDKLGQQNAKIFVTKIFYFGEQQDEEEIRELQCLLKKQKQQLFNLEKSLQKENQEKNKLENQIKGDKIIQKLINSVEIQTLQQIQKNKKTVNVQTNIKFLSSQEQNNKNEYQTQIKQYLQTLLKKQQELNQKISQEIKELMIKKKVIQEEIQSKKQRTQSQREKSQIKLNLDLIQNEQRAIQNLNICINRLERQLKVKGRKEINKKFKRK